MLVAIKTGFILKLAFQKPSKGQFYKVRYACKYRHGVLNDAVHVNLNTRKILCKIGPGTGSLFRAQGYKAYVRNLRMFIISYCICPWQALSNVCGATAEPS